MICDLVFKLGADKKEITLIIETDSPSYPTNQEILNALKNPINAENYQEIKSYIEKNYNVDSQDPLDVEKLFKNDKGEFCTPEGLIGNTSIQQLAMQYTDANFPEGVNANVLAVNSLKTGGRTISGRCITSNGEELFIINTKEDIDKLAAFLANRKLLEENPNYYDENSPAYADLEILRIKLNKSSIQELILDFMEYSKPKTSKGLDQNIYRTTYFTNAKGEIQQAYNFLGQITRDLRGYNQLVQYSNPFVNAISKLHRDRGDDIKAITYKELFAAIQAYYPDILKGFNMTSFETFKRKLGDMEFDQTSFKTIIPNKPFLYTLMANLILPEKRYRYRIITHTANELQLKQTFPKLKADYGINYEAIHTFDLLGDYRGYKIYAFNYDGKKIYTYSRGYLTEDSTIYKEFNSADDVKKYLDEEVPKRKLRTNSYLNFKYRVTNSNTQDPSKYIYSISNSPQVYIVGSIVESLDIAINPDTIFVENERKIKNSETSTLQDVHNLIDSWEIAENIKTDLQKKLDSPEKAMVFLYKINEQLGNNRTNGNALLEIANYINSRPKVAYYINSNNSNNYNLIPTEPNIVEKWKVDKSAPVKELFVAIQKVLADKIGVKVHLLTSAQIAETFKNIESIDPNTSKAFIYNGEIYVNTTIASGEDLLHEYTHILLGVLKSNPESLAHYEILVNNVWEKANDIDRKQAMRDYQGRSQMDIREELFARKFSEYLLNKRTDNLSQIFQEQQVYLNEYLEKGTKIIFDLLGDEPLAKTYSTRQINDVFKRFSSDVATLLKSGNGLDLDKITESRKKANFIRKQINDGNITELC